MHEMQLASGVTVKRERPVKGDRPTQRFASVRRSLYLREDDHEGVQGQRLDKREAKDERELDAGPGSRIARQRFGSGGSGFRLSQSAEAGSDGHGEAGGDGDPVGARGSGLALRQHRHGKAHDGQHKEYKTQSFTHGVAPSINLPQWVVDLKPCRGPHANGSCKLQVVSCRLKTEFWMFPTSTFNLQLSTSNSVFRGYCAGEIHGRQQHENVS